MQARNWIVLVAYFFFVVGLIEISIFSAKVFNLFMAKRRTKHSLRLLDAANTDEIDSSIATSREPERFERRLCPICHQFPDVVRNRFEEHRRDNGKICAASFLTPSAARLVYRKNKGRQYGDEQEENRSGRLGSTDRGEVSEGGADPTDEAG